jgi:hypothetical protein
MGYGRADIIAKLVNIPTFIEDIYYKLLDLLGRRIINARRRQARPANNNNNNNKKEKRDDDYLYLSLLLLCWASFTRHPRLVTFNNKTKRHFLMFSRKSKRFFTFLFEPFYKKKGKIKIERHRDVIT